MVTTDKVFLDSLQQAVLKYLGRKPDRLYYGYQVHPLYYTATPMIMKDWLNGDFSSMNNAAKSIATEIINKFDTYAELGITIIEKPEPIFAFWIKING